MRSTLAFLVLFLLAIPARAQAWQPVERIVTYPIEGGTGIALYRSIGENGPKIAGRRVVAHTRFDLLWTRRYREQPDGSCVLAVAVPHLTVTTTLPKAPAGLPPALEASWRHFIDGIAEHERFHGREIVAMVRRIAAFSAGLSAPADPGCRKVRAKLQGFLAKSIAAHRKASRAFDADEWGKDGAMHRLVLEFVNGP